MSRSAACTPSTPPCRPLLFLNSLSKMAAGEDCSAQSLQSLPGPVLTTQSNQPPLTGTPFAPHDLVQGGRQAAWRGSRRPRCGTPRRSASLTTRPSYSDNTLTSQTSQQRVLTKRRERKARAPPPRLQRQLGGAGCRRRSVSCTVSHLRSRCRRTGTR